MTHTQIHDRINELLQMIQINPEDQDCLYKCEMEIAYLEDIKEEMDEGD